MLLKSVEGAQDDGGALLPEVRVGAPGAKGIVDEYFPQALTPGLECWVVSGRHPERLGELLRTGRARGTRLR